MHVTDGVTPMKADTNVRFRTTYYFRVFDYCWSGDANIDADHTYQKIVPETDTLYRYRMTGKASALANQIRFESGMLRKEPTTGTSPLSPGMAKIEDLWVWPWSTSSAPCRATASRKRLAP